MKNLYAKHFRDRPTTQMVALFSGLNLILIAMFSLTRFPTPNKPVIFSPTQVLIHLAITILAYACILYFLRVGKRTKIEFAVMIILAISIFTLWTMWLPFQFFAIALIPIVARNWLSLRQTLWVIFCLVFGKIIFSIYFLFNNVRDTNGIPISAIIITTTVTSLIFTVYAMVSFELAVREAKARKEMGIVYTELEQSYSLLNNYHDLEMKHTHLAERTRISRELHDTLGHHLTAQHFDLNVALKLSEDTNIKDNIAKALQRNQDAIEGVRQAVHALQEGKLEQLNLTEAIKELVNLSQERTIDFQIHGIEKQLSTPLTLTLYRVAQESLTNHLKHSPDTPLALSLSYTNDTVEFQAQNPLLETEEKQPLIEGFGLTSLKERVEELGGQWKAELSTTGLNSKEFQIWAKLPI